MDRLVKESIDIEARSLGYPTGADGKPRWQVTGNHEIAVYNIAGYILGGIGYADATSSLINLAKLPGNAIIVITNLSFVIQTTAIINNNFLLLALQRSIRFVKGSVPPPPSVNTNILAQPSSFTISSLFSNSVPQFFYQFELSFPEIFPLETQGSVGLTATHNADCTVLNGTGKALIINSF
jgi:hypothetical protein